MAVTVSIFQFSFGATIVPTSCWFSFVFSGRFSFERGLTSFCSTSFVYTASPFDINAFSVSSFALSIILAKDFLVLNIAY